MVTRKDSGRKRVLLSLLTLMLLLFPGVANAAQGSAEAEISNVVDDAGLMSETEVQALETEVDALMEDTGWIVYALTTGDAGGKSSMEYADDYYDAHTEQEDGIVLLVDMDNREVYISTSGIAIRYLTDARIDSITEDAAAQAGNSDYAACFRVMVDGVRDAYDAGIPSGQYNYDTETGAVSRYHSIRFYDVLLALLFGGLAGVICWAAIVGKYRLKFGTYQYDAHRDGTLELSVKKDHLVNKFVTHHHIQQSSGSSGGGSRSSTHTSSSGRTHGGGGHKF